MTKGIIVVVSAAVAGTLGCINREVAEVEPNQSKEQVLDVRLNLKSDLDILFVIDNSNSMSQEQTSLLQNFGEFINVLSTIEGLGLPNIHIGVVSTDLGTGPFRIGGCDAGGDAGTLQNAPRQAGCSPPAGQFISDISDGAGGRLTNYSGTLTDTFACIAELGVDGCGFEQPLEAMRKALDGTNPANQGFLRDDALLAIVIITDEDDCSTEDDQMFDTSQTSIDDPLGPISGHRCFEFGVVCDPDNPRQLGDKTACIPREDSPYMYGVQEYIDFVHGLKPDERDIFVAGIMGPTDPVRVVTGENGHPAVEHSCETPGLGKAEPPIRLRTFVDAFRHGTATTICDNNLQGALTLIALEMARALGNPCFEGDVRTDPLECTVSQVLDEQETLLPRCDDDIGGMADNQPCHIIFEDRDSCPDTPSGLTIQTFPEDRTVPTGTRLVARCVAN